jgi:lysophospholipase L1-like esterase
VTWLIARHRDPIRTRSNLVRLAVGLLFTAAALTPALSAQSSGDRFVGTWSTALVGRPQVPPLPGPPGPPPFMPNSCPPNPAAPAPAAQPGQTFAPPPFMHFTNQTLRQVVRVSLGGSRVRVLLSNAFGNAPITIGAAFVALRDKDEAIQAGGHPLTFSGRTTMTIPAYATAYSDPVNLTVAPLTDLAIDLYLPGTTNAPAVLTMHNAAFQTNYISETGNHAGHAKLPMVATIRNWFLLSRVEVETRDAAGVVVTFGDSITDGTASTPDANHRWPDVFGKRLLTAPTPVKMGILNAGIAGNRILSEGTYTVGINALARFDVDALSQPGVTHIVVLEGINDIGNARQNPTPTAEDLVAGHKQLIERAHARGLKIYGATLTPFWGAAYYTDAGEAKRQAVNNWIRSSGAYDGVIDFDKATRDPNDSKKFLAEYDSCDHLHPNDAGYKAMAEAVDLDLFKVSAKR